MQPREGSPRWSRFYILDDKNRPVQVSDRDSWSRWMAENDLVFRRTLLEQSGCTVTTRFRGVSEAAPKDTPLFITRVTGLPAGTGEGQGESYGAPTLDAALEQHERIVQELLRALTGR